ncbi:MAG: hypothetical protein HGA45_27330 [Chloroflexales bacterium]|nr:hypothetical protein [Chloroflexales bacterium]
MTRTIRLVHRWLAPVFLVLLIAVLSTQGSAVGLTLQRVQQLLMLGFALSGAVMFAQPYWLKWRRGQRRAAEGEPRRAAGR